MRLIYEVICKGIAFQRSDFFPSNFSAKHMCIYVRASSKAYVQYMIIT